MKNFLLVLLMVFTFSLSNAQTEYGSYQNLGKTIKSAVTDDGEVYLNLNEDGSYGLILKNEKERQVLINFLEISFTKYIEWAQTAKNNNVKNVMKDINELPFRGFFRYGSWNFGHGSLRTIFNVSETGETHMYLYGPNLTSSSNKYIKSRSSVILSMETQGDINSIVNIINEETIQGFLTDKKNKKDLFTD